MFFKHIIKEAVLIAEAGGKRLQNKIRLFDFEGRESIAKSKISFSGDMVNK